MTNDEIHDIKKRFCLGQWVQTMREFSGVPKFTEGMIVEDYGTGMTVAWDRPDNPIPRHKTPAEIARMPGTSPAAPLRDGFAYGDLCMLVRIQGRVGWSKSTQSTVLKLILTSQWFRMIAEGSKREEYRDITPYWEQRIEGKNLTHVTFYLGYSKYRPSITFHLQRITKRTGNPDWGAEPGKDYYVLELGAVTERERIN